MLRMPDFVYIGTDKAGSTWLYDVLAWHPEVYVPRVKDLYYFDRFYHRGRSWYAAHFRGASPRQVAGELSHDYLYSEAAFKRIRNDIPDAKIIATLRNPINRAYSAYLQLIRHGLRYDSFKEAIEHEHEIVERGMYSKFLKRYFDIFGREQIHIGIFDDLADDPARFAREIFGFLGVEMFELPARLRDKTLPAAGARIPLLARLIRSGSHWARAARFELLVGMLKRSNFLTSLLYRRYSEDERPRMSDEMRIRMLKIFNEDVKRVEELIGVRVWDKWIGTEVS